MNGRSFSHPHSRHSRSFARFAANSGRRTSASDMARHQPVFDDRIRIEPEIVASNSIQQKKGKNEIIIFTHNRGWTGDGAVCRRANHHYRVIDPLSLTLGTDAGSIKKFDIFRKKRNISDYERADTISASDVEEMRSLAEKLRVDFEAWIQKKHPQLKP